MMRKVIISREKSSSHDILVGVLTALMAALFSFILYFIQFRDTKGEARYAAKLASFESFSKNASNMIYYLRFIDWIHLEENKYAFSRYYSTGGNISSIGLRDLNIKTKDYYAFEQQIKKTYPLQFEYFKAGAIYQGDYLGSYYSAQRNFEKKTNDQIDILAELLRTDRYENTVDSFINGNIANVIQLDDAWVDGRLYPQRKNQLDRVLKAMRAEIDVH